MRARGGFFLTDILSDFYFAENFLEGECIEENFHLFEQKEYFFLTFLVVKHERYLNLQREIMFYSILNTFLIVRPE